MTQPTVLISGAGIAGPALAFWLNKSGYRVTIVELADDIRAERKWSTTADAIELPDYWAF
jgi:2-polyprenyl-6-methoxyphenol hydroxylase-like FAD-dependent oxidoreductase